MKMKKFLAILLCVCMVVAIVACNKTDDTDKETPTTDAPTTDAPTTDAPTTDAPTNQDPDINETPITEAEYKLGMGIVVSLDSSATGNAQVDATVAAVVLDADGKIVACRIDAVQNKMNVTDGAVDTSATFKTKMEKGDEYGMAAAVNYGMDWNGDGVVKEWYDQAKAFEAYVVGKTAAEVAAIATQTVEGAGYVIAADEDLLAAGCTIQITDFKDAVAKACEDAQGMTFATSEEFTLGVAATSTVDSATVAATAEANGTVAMYSDFACAVVVDGKIVASLNDAIQPKITIDAAGEIVEKTFSATKRELKEDYHMAAYGQSMDWNGDGVVLEWYLQSEAFSKHVVGMTAAEVADMATQVVDGAGYVIAADEDLLAAGCTIQITSMKAVVAQSVTNAR